MRSTRVLLEDIAEAIQGIEHTLADTEFAGFQQSWVMQRAVERGLEIVSEASRGLDAGHKASFPKVAWSQIAGIGNVLRHEYHRVEPLIIWNIMLEHLPRLKRAIEAMIADEEN